ncbi:hypothetical protein BOTBODRAFT_175042 [Botryobasidium botryosum FD-172 SS1]|uniref:Uncharacterized protein n=1 Tax=Botryobasidium botryosum (strain FD-172 SS1) TaxID=930990 RepID=A0A067MQQ4_BOTB1|nr:hypothetical protein BOTBODRAFT_175042 [Botryobasidium botryosum FD-172 SS1]
MAALPHPQLQAYQCPTYPPYHTYHAIWHLRSLFSGRPLGGSAAALPLFGGASAWPSQPQRCSQTFDLVGWVLSSTNCILSLLLLLSTSARVYTVAPPHQVLMFDYMLSMH